LTHDVANTVDPQTLLKAAETRLRAAGDLPEGSIDRLLELLHALNGFELGRFLIRHAGANGYWAHRLVTHQDGKWERQPSPLERCLFEGFPTILATRERFHIFQRELQALLRPGIAMAALPCGWMGDLLLLDYRQCSNVRLVGIDLDPDAIDGARSLAEERGLAAQLSLRPEDAWTHSLHEDVDVLTSSGLNVYEPDDARVVEMYRAFLRALRPGGSLITSFLTPPPSHAADSPWRMSEIDAEMHSLEHLVFTRIVGVKWRAYRTHEQTRAQLLEAGFTDMRFIDDRACVFPTVIARKAEQPSG
jgi:hypothetical protein